MAKNEKESIEEKEEKFATEGFIVGDVGEDIKDLIIIVNKLKKRIKALEDRVDVLEG